MQIFCKSFLKNVLGVRQTSGNSEHVRSRYSDFSKSPTSDSHSNSCHIRSRDVRTSLLHGQCSVNVSYLSLLFLLVDHTRTCPSRFVLFLRVSEGYGLKIENRYNPEKIVILVKIPTIYMGIRDSQNVQQPKPTMRISGLDAFYQIIWYPRGWILCFRMLSCYSDKCRGLRRG